jgi:hypothetical protein
MAYAVIRPDHAKTNFNFRRYCGDALHFVARAARNPLSAAAASAGVHSYFKVHFVATCSGPFFSAANEAVSAGYRVAG